MEAMAPNERTFSIRTAMLILTVGSGIVAIAAALVVGWLSYREYRAGRQQSDRGEPSDNGQR